MKQEKAIKTAEEHQKARKARRNKLLMLYGCTISVFLIFAFFLLNSNNDEHGKYHDIKSNIQKDYDKLEPERAEKTGGEVNYTSLEEANNMVTTDIIKMIKWMFPLMIILFFATKLLRCMD